MVSSGSKIKFGIIKLEQFKVFAVDVGSAVNEDMSLDIVKVLKDIWFDMVKLFIKVLGTST